MTTIFVLIGVAFVMGIGGIVAYINKNPPDDTQTSMGDMQTTMFTDDWYEAFVDRETA